MGLKQLIKQQKLLAATAKNELVLPGEPLIYSIKYSMGSRTRFVQFFRNQKWKSLLKCYFRSYYRTDVPVVVIVRFYVSPPSSVRVNRRRLKKDSVPATEAYELCDYLLSFLEMLHHVLINSYCQIVKVDAEKFYSSEPRTVFKFMKWEHYVELQNNNSVQPKTESISPDESVLPLQPQCQGNAEDKGVCS